MTRRGIDSQATRDSSDNILKDQSLISYQLSNFGAIGAVLQVANPITHFSSG